MRDETCNRLDDTNRDEALTFIKNDTEALIFEASWTIRLSLGLNTMDKLTSFVSGSMPVHISRHSQ